MSIPANAKYAIIREMTMRDNNRLNLSWLCETACVSRSGYYSYLQNEAKKLKSSIWRLAKSLPRNSANGWMKQLLKMYFQSKQLI